MNQTRIIEKRGVLIPTAEEREAHWLSIFASVIQKPSSEYLNNKYNPAKGWYGVCQLLSQGYVYETITIEFYNQRLYFAERYAAQAVELLGGGIADVKDILASVSLRVTVPVAIVLVPSSPLKYPYIPLTEARFTLPDGCVIAVNLVHEKFRDSTNVNVTDPKDPPAPPPPSTPPPVPNPSNLPPRTGTPGSGAEIEITPPYDPLTNDGGNTYVPPTGSPSDYTSAGNNYTVEVRLTINDGGVAGSSSVNEYKHLPGPIGGLGTNNENNSDAPYGIIYGGGQIRQILLNYQRYGYQGRTNGFLVKIIKITKE